MRNEMDSEYSRLNKTRRADSRTISAAIRAMRMGAEIVGSDWLLEETRYLSMAQAVAILDDLLDVFETEFTITRVEAYRWKGEFSNLRNHLWAASLADLLVGAVQCLIHETWGPEG